MDSAGPGGLGRRARVAGQSSSSTRTLLKVGGGASGLAAVVLKSHCSRSLPVCVCVCVCVCVFVCVCCVCVCVWACVRASVLRACVLVHVSTGPKESDGGSEAVVQRSTAERHGPEGERRHSGAVVQRSGTGPKESDGTAKRWCSGAARARRRATGEGKVQGRDEEKKG